MWQQLPLAVAFFAIGGWPWVVWGVFVRVGVCVTGHWLVGHFAHTSGEQSWHIDGVAVQGYNVRYAGFVTMGEAFHNNHHAFPSSAKMGLLPGQTDLGWRLIRVLERLGLAWNIRTPENLPQRSGLRPVLRPEADWPRRNREPRSNVIFPFSFEGEIRRLPYAVWSSAIFFSQHLLTIIAFRIAGTPLEIDWRFLFVPLRSFVTQTYASSPTLLLVFVYLLAVSWALAGLAFRRAANADVGGWIAAAAMVPFIQVPIIGSLSLLRLLPRARCLRRRSASTRSGWASAAHGVIVGIALTLLAVALSTLAFRSYGYGVFVLAPFVIGAAAAWIRQSPFRYRRRPNRAGRDRGDGARRRRACAGSAGRRDLHRPGLAARYWRGVDRRPARERHRSLAASGRPARGRSPASSCCRSSSRLKVVLPPATDFATRQTIDVAAPPEIVWDSIVDMERIEEPSALPFRLGVAYPLGGEIVGEGVGAVRRGEFSTGIAIERVTEWIPNRKLAFVVVEDVPSMRELSPYEACTHRISSAISKPVRRASSCSKTSDGGTRDRRADGALLKLDPVLYWLPLARWMVHENNMRVLDHIRRQAEAHCGKRILESFQT